MFQVISNSRNRHTLWPSWMDNLSAFAESLKRPGQFTRHFPLADKALTSLEGRIQVNQQTDCGANIWESAQKVVGALYERAPSPESVPPTLALRALRMRWNAIARQQKVIVSSPPWGAMLQIISKILPRSTEENADLRRKILLGFALQYEIHYRFRTKQNSSSCVNEPFPRIQSVEQLQKERDTFMKYALREYEKSPFVISRILNIEKALFDKSQYHDKASPKSSWQDAICCLHSFFSASAGSERTINISICKFLLVCVPPSVAKHVVVKYLLRIRQGEISSSIHLQSGKKLTFMLLCIVALAKDVALFTKILKNIQPVPSQAELQTALFHDIQQLFRSPDIEAEEDAARLVLFDSFSMWFHPSESNRKRTLPPHELRRRLVSKLQSMLSAKNMQFFHLRGLAYPHDKEEHAAEEDRPLLPLTTNKSHLTKCDKLTRTILVAVSSSQGGKPTHYNDIKLYPSLYETSPVEQEESTSMGKNIIIHSRTKVEVSRAETKIDLQRTLLHVLQWQPSTIRHQSVLAAIRHLRQEYRSKKYCDSWRKVLEVCSLTRHSHPDIRAQLFDEFLVKLRVEECIAFTRETLSWPEASYSELSTPFWKVAMSHACMSDLEDSKVASILLDIAMLHPSRWVFALQLYCSAASFDPSFPKRTRLLDSTSFLFSVMKASQVTPMSTAPLSNYLSHRYCLFNISPIRDRDSLISPAPRIIRIGFEKNEIDSAYVREVSLHMLNSTLFDMGGCWTQQSGSTWELTLRLLYARPEFVLSSRHMSFFILLSLCETRYACTNESSPQFYYQCRDIAERLLRSADQSGRMEELLDSISTAERELDDLLHPPGKCSLNSCDGQAISNVLGYKPSYFLFKVVLFLAHHVIGEVNNQSETVRNSKNNVQGDLEDIPRKSLSEKYRFLELLSYSLCSTQNRFNTLLSRLIENSACRATNLKHDLHSHDQALSTFPRVRQQKDLYESAEKEIQEISKRSHVQKVKFDKGVRELVPDCPELFLESGKHTVTKAAKCTSLCEVLFCDEQLAVLQYSLCLSAIESLAIGRMEIRRLCGDSRYYCVDLVHLNRNAPLDSLSNNKGQSLIEYSKNSLGVSGSLPIVREIFYEYQQKSSAMIFLPRYITPALRTYVVFAESQKSYGRSYREWVIDMKNQRVLLSRSISSSRSSAYCRFMSKRYRLDVVFVRLVGTCKHQSHSASWENARSSAFRCMLVISCRETLSDGLLRRLLELIRMSKCKNEQIEEGES